MTAGERALGLIGRSRECAELERLVATVQAGEGRALVLRGEPGIGKSALMEFATSRGESMLVLRAIGVEAESELAFAGLYGLVRPIVDRLRALPALQAGALAGALGLAPAADADRFLVAAALLGLLSVAAEARPVLCLIDDAQWLDRASADALLFAARRIHADPVGVVFAARSDGPQLFVGAGVPVIDLAAVDESSAAQILDRSGPELAPAVRARLLAEAEGNPLALVELKTGLSDTQLRGRAPLPVTIPLTLRLQALFGGRIAELPDATRTALVIAAAEGAGELGTVLLAGAQLGLAPDALDPAERAGLIRAASPEVRFRHPLVRAAVYEAATSGQRQTAHRALAQVLTGDENADRRVWHQAMATTGRDEAVATALEASARRAQQRAAHASAASLFERAAELTTERSRVVTRLADSAEAAWEAGQAERARGFISRALSDRGVSGSRPRLLHLQGVIESCRGDLRAALPTLIEAAGASQEPSLTLEILHEAVEAAAGTGDLETVRDLVTQAVGLPTVSALDRFNQEVMRGFGALLSAEYDAAQASFEVALLLADQPADDPRALIRLTEVASAGLGHGAGLRFAKRAVDQARSYGRLSSLPFALAELGMELLWVSDFDGAYIAAQEGYALSQELGHGAGWHLAVMANVEAICGREYDALEHATSVLALAQTSGQTFLATFARTTLRLLELTAGRADHAAEGLLELTTSPRPELHPIVALTAVPDTIEAVIRAGRAPEQTEIPLARFREWVRSAPTDSRRALLARCDALISPSTQTFEQAIAQADALPPFQRARSELLYGEWLRRARRRTEARPHLRAALELFQALGATPWADRADAELRATGETARKRQPSTLDDLTPQELQIARLTAEGLTNPQIAAQLFVSPRTVEYHLHKVFTKLQISSRAELIRHGAPNDAPDHQH